MKKSFDILAQNVEINPSGMYNVSLSFDADTADVLSNVDVDEALQDMDTTEILDNIDINEIIYYLENKGYNVEEI